MSFFQKKISNSKPLKWLSGGLFALTLLPLSDTAFALTLINRTAEEQWVWMEIGIEIQDIFLKPEETVTGLCESGCSIALPGWEEIELEGTETVSVDEVGLKIAK